MYVAGIDVGSVAAKAVVLEVLPRQPQAGPRVIGRAVQPTGWNTAEAGEHVLEKACAQIRADGYSVDVEEFMLGLIGMAVPILDDKGDCRATMALHAPTARLKLENALAALPALRRAAERVRPLLF